MGTLKRVGRVAHAAWQAGDAAVGMLGFDYIRAPFVDDPKLNGFWHTILGRPVARAADLMMSTMGPEGVGGEAIGALPGPVRHYGHNFTAPIMDISQNLYRNVISEPIATMYTYPSYMSSKYADGGWAPSMDQLTNAFNADDMREIYKTVQHRSPGQAAMLYLSMTDIRDPKELGNFQQTDAYKAGSGLLDFAVRWKLDPQVLAGEGLHWYKGVRSPTISAEAGPITTTEDMANHINGQKMEADRYSKMAEQFRADQPEYAALLKLQAQRILTGIGEMDPDWLNRFHSDTLGVDRWRSNALTDEVSAWHKRNIKSFHEFQQGQVRTYREQQLFPTSEVAEPFRQVERPSTSDYTEWARGRMADLNERLTRTEYPQKIEYNPDGTPKFVSTKPQPFNPKWGDLREMPEGGFHKDFGKQEVGKGGQLMSPTRSAGAPHPNFRYDAKTDAWVLKEGLNIPAEASTGTSIGLKPFNIESFTEATLSNMNPDRLLREADFGPGVKHNPTPGLIQFEATPRGYVPKGHEPENLAHVAHDQGLVGRDMIDRNWTRNNNMTPTDLLGPDALNSQFGAEGIGAPGAKVVDQSIGRNRQMVAVTTGVEGVDPSILRATKKINSHADIKGPSVQVMSVTHAEKFVQYAKEMLKEANWVKEKLPFTLGYQDFLNTMEESLGRIRPSTGVIEQLRREFPEESWTGSLVQQKKIAQRAFELAQQKASSAVITMDFNHLLTPEEIIARPVTSGQLAHSGARITAPMVWDERVGKYVAQSDRYDLHGDVRVKDPGLIPGDPLKPPNGEVLAPLEINAALNDKMTRFGITQQTPYAKFKAVVMGMKHNPDPHFTEEATMPRSLISLSKKEQELAYEKGTHPGTLALADQVPPHLIPDTLYHTTGYADKITESGAIEARRGGGFGGDPYNLQRPGVSLTSNEAAATVNERWLREVVGPMAEALGEHPTELQAAEWLTSHVDELMGEDLAAGAKPSKVPGEPGRIVPLGNARDEYMALMDARKAKGFFTGVPHNFVYSEALNNFMHHWVDSHDLAVMPEMFVQVPDDIISQIRAANVKTYMFDGTDMAGAPGVLGNPMMGDEYRYYGDIPLVGKVPVEHGGQATASWDIAKGQEWATEPNVKQAQILEREATRIRWEYNHDHPGPLTQSDKWMAMGKIRDRFWPHDDQGSVYAWAMAEAKNPTEMDLAFRNFLGDYRAHNELKVESIVLKKTLKDFNIRTAAIRGRMDAMAEMDVINSLGESMTEYYSGKLAEMQSFVDQTAAQLELKNRMIDAFATMSQIPEPTWTNAVRSSITNSELYQVSPWTKPIRVFTNMMPHHILNANDPTSDVQFARMMRDAGMHPDEVLEYRGKYMAATAEERLGIVQQVDSALIQRMMEEHNLTPTEMDEIMSTATRQKQKAASLVNRTQYDALPEHTEITQATNHLGIRFQVIEDAYDVVYAPILADTQTVQAALMTDFRSLRKALGPIADWKRRYAGLRYAIEIPVQMMQKVQQVWRGAVLFRPAWPMRIIFDEQMRMMVKVGVMQQMAALGEGWKSLTDFTFRKAGFKMDQLVPKVDELVDSPVHMLENLPPETAAAQFNAQIDALQTDVEKMDWTERKMKEAIVDRDARAHRERTARDTMEGAGAHAEEAQKEFIKHRRAFENAQLNTETRRNALAAREEAWDRNEGPRARMNLMGEVVSKEEYTKLERQTLKHYEQMEQEAKQRAIAAAETAEKAGGQFASQNAKMHHAAMKSDLDEAENAVRIATAAHETQLRRAAARMRTTFAERPPNEYEQMAQDVVNPQAPAPSMEGPTRPVVTGRGRMAGAVAGGAVGGLIAGPAGAVAGASAGTILMQALAKLEKDGTDQFGVNSYRVQKALGTAADKQYVLQQAVSTRGDLYEFLSKQERDAVDGMEFNPHQWRTVPFSDPAHGTAWAGAMRNLQRDRMGAKILKMGQHAMTEEGSLEIQRWLTDTVEGRQYARKIPQRAGWEKEWVDSVISQAYRYTAKWDPVLMDKLKVGEARPSMINHIPKAERPSVHGPELLGDLGDGQAGHFAKGMEKAWKILGTLPTDHLSRMPYFNKVYEAEITRMLDPYPPGRIPEATVRTMEARAREHALNETKILLYDLAERSQFAEMAKFFMPFFGAWQEVMTRWAGLAVENPVFAARAVQVWGAPNKIPGLAYKDPTTGADYIQIRLPEMFKGLLNHGPLSSAIDSEGHIRFAKSSISMLASGMPGFGPFVNLSVSQIVKSRPEVIDAVKSLLPYGVSDSVLDPFLPSAGRRLLSLYKGDDDAAYASTWHQVFNTRMSNILSHKDPTWGPEDVNTPEFQASIFKEVDEETRKLYSIRLVSSLVSPVAIQFDSIYKPLIDDYRQMRELNPNTADQRFMDKYGDDMIYLTQAVTQTNNGVPPTLHGAEAEQKFGKLISKYPDYGSVIVGPDAGGEAAKFMSQVYNRQLTTPVAPGSDIMQRERLSHLEQLEAPEVRLGWQEFSREMDRIDAYMIQKGFKTYAQAPEMRKFKNQVVSDLAHKYPAWGDQYFIRDERKWDKRIEAFTAMVNEPGLKDRPDMQGLAEYLKYRKQVKAILDKRGATDRGSADLFAKSNSDIFNLWADTRMSLKEENLQFADLYNRYLDRDPLTTDPILGTSE